MYHTLTHTQQQQHAKRINGKSLPDPNGHKLSLARINFSHFSFNFCPFFARLPSPYESHSEKRDAILFRCSPFGAQNECLCQNETDRNRSPEPLTQIPRRRTTPSPSTCRTGHGGWGREVLYHIYTTPVSSTSHRSNQTKPGKSSFSTTRWRCGRTAFRIAVASRVRCGDFWCALYGNGRRNARGPERQNWRTGTE